MKMKALMEFCDLNMGQSPNSETYNEENIGLPFFQGNADFGEVYPKVRIWCSSPVKVAAVGDILISVRAPIGAMNIANTPCCIGRGLAALSPNPDTCMREYLYYALQSRIDWLIAQGTGSTFKAIGRKTLEGTQIPAYSLDEQQIISDTLSKTDQLITKAKAQASLLDELVKSRFVEMFGDVIHNDRGWPQHSFSKITSSRLGKMLDTKQQTGLHSYPYLANFNVQWFRFDLKNLNQMDFNEADQVEFALQDGDVLVCEGGEIGRCAVWHDEIQPCFFQKALHRVRCDKSIILPDYLAWWFKYNCDHGGFAAIEGAKATIAHLPGAKLKQLQVTVPPISHQNHFASFVSEVDKSKLAVKQSLEKLETLKKSLMQQYFG